MKDDLNNNTLCDVILNNTLIDFNFYIINSLVQKNNQVLGLGNVRSCDQ
jgi:hypothetical protein